MTAALDLQSAIVSALRQSNDLTALLGGPRVFDDVPEGQKPPYVVIGPVETLDWSTATEEGEEHFVEITAWSHSEGRKPALLAAGLIRHALEALPANLPDHTLVNLTHETTLTRADGNDRHFSARMTFRAVTEPHTA